MTRGRFRAYALLALAILVAGAAVGSAADMPRSKLPFGTKNTIALVRVKSLNAIVKAVTAVATQFDPNAGPMIEMQVNQMFQQIPGVDRDAAVALIFLDPKRFKEPLVGVFAVKDVNVFKQGCKADHVQTVGKLGLIGDDEGAVAEVAAELKAKGLKAVPAADMGDMVVANADIGGLMKRYKTEIQGALMVAKMQLGGAPTAGMEPAPDAKPDPAKQMAVKALGYAGKLITGIEQQVGPVEFGLSIAKEQITIHFFVEGTAGSPFADFIGKLNRPARRTLANYLPKNASETNIVVYDPASSSKVLIGVLKAACDIFGLSAEETGALVKVATDTISNSTGLQGSAEVPVKGGVAGVGLSGIKDRDKARACTKAVVELAKKGTIGDFLKKYGAAFALIEKHRLHAGVPIDKMEIQVDYDKLLGALPLPGDANAKQQMKKILKMSFGQEDKIVIETAYGKRLAVSTYGLNCEKLMNDEIDLMKSGGADGIGKQTQYLAETGRHPRSAFAVSHVSLFGKISAMAAMMKKMGGPTPMVPMPTNLFPTRDELPPAETPITASMRAEGNKVMAAIHVPVKPIKDVADAVKKKMQQMMQQMMENMQPAQ